MMVVLLMEPGVPVEAEGDFDKRRLDAEFVRQREALVTRGWRRLQEITQLGEISLLEYPLPEVRRRMEKQSDLT